MFGQPVSAFTLADNQNSQRYAFLAQPIWAWAIASIKISVLLMLLRLQTDRFWRRFCWAMMGLVLLLAVYNMISQLTQCIPLHKTWDLLGVVQGHCWGTNAIRINIYIVATIHFVTDFIVALLPITFLKKVQRPLRERAIIGVLMALGMLAGIASIIKMVVSANFGKTGDYNLDGIRVGMWSLLEELIGFIAACVPCLRLPFQRALEYFGLVSTHSKSTYGRGDGKTYASDMNGPKPGRKSQARKEVRRQRSRDADAASEENILQDQTGIGIAGGEKDGEIWCTTELRIDNGPAIQSPLSSRP